MRCPACNSRREHIILLKHVYMFLVRNGNDFAAMLILAGLLGKLSGVRPGKPVRATPGNVAGGWGEELLKRPLVEAAGLNIW